MKKQTYLFILLICILVLTACSEKESKDEVIQAIEESMDEVISYYTEQNQDIEVAEATKEVGELDQGAAVEAKVIEEPFQLSGKNFVGDQWTELYITKDAMYEKAEGENWIDTTDNLEHSQGINPSYGEVVQILLDLKNEDDLVMKKKNSKYLFTFEGENPTISEAFLEPYTLSLKEGIADIMIIVDSETYYVEHVENKTIMEDTMPKYIEEIEFRSLITHTYENFNEYDEITVPQEVIDEAN